jgi:Zn-dependent protease
METNYPPPPPPPRPPSPPIIGAPHPQWDPSYQPTTGEKLKKIFASIGIVLAICLKFFAKLKFILLPVLKFLPVLLKTGGTMLITIWVYTMFWGVWYAVGFVLLIFVHECGHLLAAKKLGLKVGAPVFIPFMGAMIALKEAPRDAWIEAQIGIGGPMLGTLGAGICHLIFLATGQPIFSALAYSGFLLNLFNLTPVGFLDGGRIVTALSPWLWLIGFAIMAALCVFRFNILLLIILLASLPRLFSLFRKKSEAERRYFEITPQQRWTMAVMYFGLILLLVVGMQMSHIPQSELENPRSAKTVAQLDAARIPNALQ